MRKRVRALRQAPAGPTRRARRRVSVREGNDLSQHPDRQHVIWIKIVSLPERVAPGSRTATALLTAISTVVDGVAPDLENAGSLFSCPAPESPRTVRR
jgi:hypothetical protein